MEPKKPLSRRHFFKAGIGAAGTLIAGHSLAQTCMRGLTGSQPLGPFFPNDGTPEIPVRENPDPKIPIAMANDHDLTYVQGREGQAQGQLVTISGRVTREDCSPVPGATLTIWQASASGRYNHQGDDGNLAFQHPKTGETIERDLDPFFQYWGQTKSNLQGHYTFRTVVPGFYPANLEGGWYRPPHVHFMVSAMGMPQLVTQMYFRGELIKDNDYIQELNAKDFLLQHPDLTEAQREELIVDFERSVKWTNPGDLEGYFNITMKA